MITLSQKDLHKTSWQEDSNSIEDFMILASGSYFYANVSANKIKSVAVPIMKFIKWTLLLPIRFSFFTIAITLYFVIAVSIRAILHSQIKKVYKLKMEVKTKIENNKISIDNLKNSHSKIKTYLDNMGPRLQKLQGEPIMKPKLDVLVSEMKEIELMERMAAYPERNEIVLTYDELKELNELTDLTV